jgi:glyoxylase I family protein
MNFAQPKDGAFAPSLAHTNSTSFKDPLSMNKKTTLLVLLAAALVSSGYSSAGDSSAPAGAPTQHVTGIGGFFFHADDPAALAKWYKEKLGVDPVPTDYGQKPWTQEAGPTAFAPFPSDTKFGKKGGCWMINFRVNDLDAMVAQLRASGETVKVDPAVYPNGRFARLHDPEGNPVELWEPKKNG